MLDWKHKALLAIIGAGLIAGVLGFRSWLSDHDMRLRAETQSKAKDALIEQNQEAVKSLVALVAQVREDNAKQVATLNQTVAALKAPDQQLAWAVAQLRSAPGQPPVTINVPKDTQQPATVTVPQGQIPAITEAVRECQQCRLDLTAKTRELDYSEQQKQKFADSLATMTEDRNNWKSVASGGTRWKRFKRAVKWIGIGAAVGATAICGSGHCK